MLRTLRILAPISFVWMVGIFLIRVTSIGSGGPIAVLPPLPPVIVGLLSTLGGELGFAVGVVALVAAVSHRQLAWGALFALLLVLLHVLPMFMYRTPAFPDPLALFAAPLAIFGQKTWVILLPALIPAVVFAYALIAEDARPAVA